jgi:hypothetical protein
MTTLFLMEGLCWGGVGSIIDLVGENEEKRKTSVGWYGKCL